ncbi:BamA/TamA family outer membrane protein [Longimicrobium sp.]|uniref:BamA/TamA family outer membrane protein n=1 Tax=Longimicrobium sp. TaxID=2029185 RepID=UPI003B3B33D2
MSARALCPGAAALVFALAAAPAAAQAPAIEDVGAPAAADSATVAAGERYAVGGLRGWLMGTRYRDLWVAPVRVEVLDLARFAGGLTPLRRGGNVQTMALRFKGADGREYNFRSVDKELTPALPEYARETLLDDLRQDLTRAQHPAGPLVATALMDAAGVLNPGPRLVVMPDDPALGEFRADYAGLLGTMEVHADEGDDGEPLFAGSPKVSDTEDLLEDLRAGTEHRLDARGYLRARLLDMLLGDWDRHEGQWRWARYDQAGAHRWVPVPEDRDYAFVDHDGVLPAIARARLPRLVRFGERYPPVEGLTANSLGQDRELLSGLSRATWDSVAAELRAALTDRVIGDAVLRMPAEYRPLNADALALTLRVRRDRLGEAADAFYRLVAQAPEVHATDRADRVDAEHLPDGRLALRIHSRLESGAYVPAYERVFHPAETGEVRLHLHGGGDSTTVRGGAGPIVLRILAGAGDDVLVDQSRAAVVFYDTAGTRRVVPGARTRVETRAWSAPEAEPGLLPVAERDFGSRRTGFAPYVAWRSDVGALLGGGPVFTRYGYRRHPFAARHALRAATSPVHGRLELAYRGELRPEASSRWMEIAATGTTLARARFGGYGNAAPGGASGASLAWLRQVELSAAWHAPLSNAVEFSAGPVARYTDPEVDAGSPLATARPLGSEAFGQVGARAGVVLDTRDNTLFPRSGARAELSASAYPAVWSADRAFGLASGSASTYLRLPAPGAPVLALRAAAQAAWGGYPFHQAATLGGWSTLRGHAHDRFAGDAAVAGGAELRVPLLPAELLVRGRLGVSLLADAGRVIHDGESPGGWHTATGGGVWFATPPAVLAIYVARGEETTWYASFGMPF